MLTILNVFIEICRFRAGPQDIPHSRFLLVWTVIAYFLIGLATSPLEQFVPKTISAVADTFMLVGFALAGLWVRNLSNRGIQTITALAGTGVVFGIISLVVLLVFPDFRISEPSVFSSILILSLVIWNIAVIGHILKSSLDLPLWAGIGVAVLFVYTTLRVTGAIYVAHS